MTNTTIHEQDRQGYKTLTASRPLNKI